MRLTEITTAGAPEIEAGRGGRITISLPITIRRHCAHKRILGPAVATPDQQPLRLTPFQHALIKGYRWLDMLESGELASMKDLARREGVDPSVVSRLINLTTLAPEIVDAILDDMLPTNVTLLDIVIDPPLAWDEQVAALPSS